MISSLSPDALEIVWRHLQNAARFAGEVFAGEMDYYDTEGFSDGFDFCAAPPRPTFYKGSAAGLFVEALTAQA